MTNKIKWGVLGYARIAKNAVIPAIIKASNSEFYAIASRDESKRKECKELFKCNKIHSSYDALLNDPDVQAVYIPLPNSMHKEWTIKAAQKGKHVLCEKPIALNHDECMEMIFACKDNCVKLTEAFMYRYTNRIRKVQEILASNVIGQVKYINSTFRFFLDNENDIRMNKDLGGGSLYDVGCYPLNFVGMITGEEPISYSVECEKKNGVDINFAAVLRYKSGLIASISCGFNAHFRLYSEIIGTKGIMKIPNTFTGNGTSITLITNDVTREVEVIPDDRYLLEVEDFAEAILDDREPFFSLEETIRNMRIIDNLIKEISRRI